MRFSLKSKIGLMALLIVFNMILRIPWVPHELGIDSFVVHSLANSITKFGEARWWLHPASIVGSYPYSEPSSVAFLLSGVAQISGVDTETAILLYNFILTFASIFFAYLMAGAIWDNDLFKFLVAFLFSTSQGIVTFSTWTVHSRTLFVMIFPLFIYILLKLRGAGKLRFGSLALLMFVLLAATHHYIYFVIPIIASFFGSIVLYRTYLWAKKSNRINDPDVVLGGLLLATFLVMFIVPFFTRTFMDTDPRGGESRYGWMIVMIESYTRYIGPSILFTVSGYFYLIGKKEKTFGEIFMLLLIASIAPLLYNQTYTKWFIIIFAAVFGGIGLNNIVSLDIHLLGGRRKTRALLSFLMIFVLFVGYFQFLHFLNDPKPRFMAETTYDAGTWIKNTVDRRTITYRNPVRLISVAEVPVISAMGSVNLAYGFADPTKIIVKQTHTPTSLKFYTGDPYKLASKDIPREVYVRITSAREGLGLIKNNKISYYVENTGSPTGLDSIIGPVGNSVYDGGKLRIWSIEYERL